LNGAWIDRRRLVDFGDGPSRKQELADQLGEAERRQAQGVQARGDTQQQIGDHGGEDLQADGVVVGAKELTDTQMLLDPTEQQLDLPAALVERGDLDCATGQIVGDERHDPTLVTPDPDAPQRHRQPRPRMAFADAHDLAVVEDAKAVSLALAQRPASGGAQAAVHFRPRDEESPLIIDLLPPAEMAIAFVENVGRARLDRHLLADLDIIDGGGRDLDAMRAIGIRIIGDVYLHAADTPIPSCPPAQLAQRHGAGIDQPDHLRPFAPRRPVNHPRQHREGIGKHTDRTAFVGIRQRRAGKLIDVEMIMMLGVDVEGQFEPAQRVGVAQLREDQRHQMIPAFEALVVSVTVVVLHNGAKLPPIDRFEQIPKDAIELAHARPFLSLDNQKRPVCAGLAEHAP